MALAKQYGSAKKARSALKKSAAGASEFLWRLKADESFPVRFLQEPADWFEAAQHYVGGSFVWCTDPENNKECEHCENGDRPAKRALANVLDRTTGKVRILQMTTQLANSVVGKVDRPITTADYEIWREGSDKENTKYGADRMDPTPCKLSRYTIHDIEAALITELGFDPNAEEEEDEPRSSKFQRIREHDAKKKSRHEDEDDDYEDDEEEEEVDQYAEMDRSELKAEIKKYDPSFVAKKSQSDETLREILLDMVQDADEDEEEEDEPPARPKHSAKKPAKKSRDREDGLDEFKPEKNRNPVRPARRLR